MYSRIQIFDMSLPTYGVIAVLGTLLTVITGTAAVFGRRLSPGSFFRLACTGGVSTFLGAKLLCAVETAVGAGHGGISLRQFAESGYSFYGGLLAGCLGTYTAAVFLKIDFHKYAKNLIFLVPLLHGIWKVGCFMGGCCYGIPYDGPCAVVFPEGSNAPSGVMLFPVQVLEAGVSMVMAAAFYIRGRRKRWEHPVMEYIGCYAAVRFFIEFLRHHDGDLMISAAQLISIACVLPVMLRLFLEKKIRAKGSANEE